MPAKSPKELFPWIVKLEEHIAREKKAIVIHKRFVTPKGPKYNSEGAFVQIVPSSRMEALDEHEEIDLMLAISRGLIGYDIHKDEIVWGGAVRYSLSITKL